MHLFRIDKLEEGIVKNIQPFFEDLPETDHKDGKYRLRKYSVVKPLITGHLLPTEFAKLDITTFTQSSDYNDFQGDIERTFEPLDDELVVNPAFVSICNLFYYTFSLAPHQPIEVHQMRVLPKKGGKLSPEGVHQDGFDHIAMIGIRRENISGGDMHILREKEGDSIVNTPLLDGEIAFLNDRIVWHNGTPVKKIDKDRDGFMDFMVLLVDESKEYE